jgi:hypothetical protein
MTAAPVKEKGRPERSGKTGGGSTDGANVRSSARVEALRRRLSGIMGGAVAISNTVRKGSLTWRRLVGAFDLMAKAQVELDDARWGIDRDLRARRGDEAIIDRCFDQIINAHTDDREVGRG